MFQRYLSRTVVQARYFSQEVEKKVRVVNLLTNNINTNLAYEDYLFHHDNLKYPTIMMWQNDKNIVIGKHQNPWKECFLQKMERDGIQQARRKSGGGAVYQDLGNSCFTFQHPIYDNTPPLDTKNKNNVILLKGLENLGIKAELSGRNDITINGKKFSGSAYEVDLGGRFKIKKALHHGTILCNVDTLQLWNYLNPDKAKLKSKGIDSVISRVMNLQDLNKDINHQTIGEEFIKEFKNYWEGYEVSEDEVSDPLSIPKVKEIYDTLISEDWLMTKTPKFTNQIETRFKWGNIDLYMKVENGVIQDGMVYSDALVPEMIDYMIHQLRSSSYQYSESGVNDLCENIKFAHEDREDIVNMIEEMRQWMTASI